MIASKAWFVSKPLKASAALKSRYYMYYPMTKEFLTVRDVDEEVWWRFRAKTEEEGLKSGQALNEALSSWVREKEARKDRPDPRIFLKVEGIIKATKRVRWSEEIDEVLYGGKS